ncbi:RICIN domain-containing protein [Kitasatospora purpeofusca]|uniref:RICIN domain-containing protein n=1 Tax=Kitasatospora purpeofusca TaxID=67352 RepID=UPI003F4ABED4
MTRTRRSTRSHPGRPLRALGAVVLTALAAVLPAAVPASASPDPTADGWICDPGYYRINTSDGMVFDISQGPDTPGAVVQYDFWGGANQQWRVCHWPGSTDTTHYIFKSRLNGRCLTLFGGYWGEGNWFGEGDCNGWITRNQTFWLARDPATGTFAMQVQHDGFWVAVEENQFTTRRAHLVQSSTRAGAFSLQAV